MTVLKQYQNSARPENIKNDPGVGQLYNKMVAVLTAQMQIVCKCNCKNRGMGSYDQCQPDEPYVSFPPVRGPRECAADKGPSGGSAGEKPAYAQDPIAVPFDRPLSPVVPDIEMISPTEAYDTLESEEAFGQGADYSEEETEPDDSSDDWASDSSSNESESGDWDTWGDDSDDDWQADEAVNNPVQAEDRRSQELTRDRRPASRRRKQG